MKTHDYFSKIKAASVAFASVAFLLGTVGCMQQIPSEGTNPSEDTHFDYKTVADYDLNLNLSSRFSKAGITAFEVYTSNPLARRADGSEYKRADLASIFKALTDEDGRYSGTLPLPSYVDSLYIYTETIGLPNVLSVKVSGGVLNVSPMLYSTSTKATSSYPYNTVSIPRTRAIGYWDSWGFPEYLLPEYDVVSSTYINNIRSMVPEGVKLPEYNPALLNPNAVSTLKIVDSCTIDVTFVHEGAGYTNVLGYYYYPSGNPPASLADVDKYIAFPNTSYYGSGGMLLAGDKIRLKYWDAVQEEFVEGFPAGITVAWFLAANGYSMNSRRVTSGYNLFSSNPALNPESNLALRQHCLQLYDEATQRIAITFEDIHRQDPACDQDFNDAIYYAKVSPYTAVETYGITTVAKSSDRDSDGVPDAQDEFPDDADLAYTVGFPAKGVYGTLAYEDLWPSSGDYDMNDLVIGYNTTQYYNAQNQVVKASTDYQVKAVGAKFRNGFAVQLGVSPSSIASLRVTGGTLLTGVFNVDNKGLELNQTFANIPIFDDAFKLFNIPAGDYINTRMNEGKIQAKQIQVEYTFTTPQNPSTLGFPPYNAYMIQNAGIGERSKEVHLAGFRPTNLANAVFFSTGQDLTNPSKNRYYIDKNNMPFAIHLPVPFEYPTESSPIPNAYGYFKSWASSYGNYYKDWYINRNGDYRTESLIYSK